MFDLVPLARARREVADTDGEVQLIRELLAFPFPSAILEIPDQPFLLRIDGDHRLVTLVTVLHGGGNVAELSIPIRMLLALEALAVALEAVPLGLKQATDRIGTDSVLLRLQCLSDFPHALARPTQIGLWVAPRERIDEFVEIGEKCRGFFRGFLASAPRP